MKIGYKIAISIAAMIISGIIAYKLQSEAACWIFAIAAAFSIGFIAIDATKPKPPYE